jgi:hypothetical protein
VIAMRKALAIIAMALVVGCSTVPQPRDFSLGCVTDMECALLHGEDEDDMDTATYEAELDDLRYYAETGRIR